MFRRIRGGENPRGKGKRGGICASKVTHPCLREGEAREKKKKEKKKGEGERGRALHLAVEFENI